MISSGLRPCAATCWGSGTSPRCPPLHRRCSPRSGGPRAGRAAVRDRLEGVRGPDEQHVGEVERDAQVVVDEAVVLGGVRTSRSADDGSPLQSDPTLSTSSSMNTGSRLPARRTPWMMRPGSAPMYVRRWPRISASSWTPPSETRTNERPRGHAMNSPRLVLPTPGGPTKHRIGSRAIPVEIGLAPGVGRRRRG